MKKIISASLALVALSIVVPMSQASAREVIITRPGFVVRDWRANDNFRRHEMRRIYRRELRHDIMRREMRHDFMRREMRHEWRDRFDRY